MCQRALFGARFLPAVLILAAVAAPNRASAGQFAVTTISPANQSVTAGTPFSVDVVLSVGSTPAYGVQAWVSFDQTKLQVVSVTGGSSSPFTTVIANSYDNAAGKLTYGATGSTVGGTITVAKIVFNPIAAGTASIAFQNVNEYLANYGPYGVNGLAVGGSVTVSAPVVSVFGSGISPVTTWDPIFPTTAFAHPEDLSTPTQTVGPLPDDPRWTNPHPAVVFPIGTHPWEFTPPMDFSANWINSWANYGSLTRNPGLESLGPAGQSWTKYSTTITGEGSFVLQFLADNVSWIYLDGTLVGYQAWHWENSGTGRYTINLTGSAPHELVFVIWDGGGLAGGKFRIETLQSFVDHGGGTPPPPPPPTDSTPPVITPPADIVAEATAPSGATVEFSATATDDVDGRVAVIARPASGSTFPITTTVVGLAASDQAGNTAESSFTVTVQDTTAPALSVPANITVEAADASGAVVLYPAANATDAVGVTSLSYSSASGSTFAIGTTTVTVTAKDAAGNTSTRSFTVTVEDTTAPTITNLSNNTPTLWSPNHKMVPITVTAAATDLVGVTSLKIVSVTSNEPDNGLGDGDTPHDIDITGPLSVSLRAERGGGSSGRIYTITVEARDAAGNVSTKTCTVTVAKSQGGR